MSRKKIVTLSMTLPGFDVENVAKAHEAMSQVALDFAHLTEAANVSMYDYDEAETGFVDETYHSEDTLFKAVNAMVDSGLSFEVAREAIRSMQNAGILFRERPLSREIVWDDDRPHSRACGIKQHHHGAACAEDCPTCGNLEAVKLKKKIIPPMYGA